MEYSLTGATWFWLLVPMLATVVLSIVTCKPSKSEIVTTNNVASNSEGRG